jgi:lysophospholipase L1-like esterase
VTIKRPGRFEATGAERGRDGILRVVPLRLALLVALAVLGTASAAAAQPLGLSSPHEHVGWVTLRVTGPPGTVVALADGARPLGALTLPAGGVAELARAARWRCDGVPRRFTATVGAAVAAVDVRTPSCRGRLALAVAPRRPRAGRPLVVRVVDRWGVGDVAARLCARACRSVRLAPGVARASRRITPARAGRLAIALRGPAGDVVRRARLVRPASGRLRVLATGDSMIQLLDVDLRARLRAAGPAWFRSDARIATGLSKPFLLDWVALARRQARTLRPDATVMFLGANDGFGFSGAPCCGGAWVRAYAERARAVMRAYVRGGAASVFWILLPAPRPPAFRAIFGPVNRALRHAARTAGGPVHLVDLGPVLTPGGRFRAAIRHGGRTVAVRQPDGVHLSRAGAAIAAGIVERALRRDGLAGA